jgi:hypothetical protein
MPAKRNTSKPQPMEGDLTMRQAVAIRMEQKFAGEVSWKFGHASFETDEGKVFCFITRDGNLAIKLPVARIEGLIEDGSAVPLRMGQRTMREWAVVPEPESAASLRLLGEARIFVESLPKEKRKRTTKKSAASKKMAARKKA